MTPVSRSTARRMSLFVAVHGPRRPTRWARSTSDHKRPSNSLTCYAVCPSGPLRPLAISAGFSRTPIVRDPVARPALEAICSPEFRALAAVSRRRGRGCLSTALKAIEKEEK
uniref:Uncharacterized protein n=1 Tax=Plectus sambesii TaxID=2011161 RepID=A0A914VAI4_9BILA